MTIEVIELKHLKDLPEGAMIQKSPVMDTDEARAWGEWWKADRVYYWPKTLSAFILKPEAEQLGFISL